MAARLKPLPMWRSIAVRNDFGISPRSFTAEPKATAGPQSEMAPTERIRGAHKRSGVSRPAREPLDANGRTM
ncbi:MAG: hypothetical protein RLY70_2777, partial [Planctomycetota bacterium]